jgi:hypothetical protein
MTFLLFWPVFSVVEISLIGMVFLQYMNYSEFIKDRNDRCMSDIVLRIQI